MKLLESMFENKAARRCNTPHILFGVHAHQLGTLERDRYEANRHQDTWVSDLSITLTSQSMPQTISAQYHMIRWLAVKANALEFVDGNPTQFKGNFTPELMRYAVFAAGIYNGKPVISNINDNGVHGLNLADILSLDVPLVTLILPLPDDKFDSSKHGFQFFDWD